MEKEKIEIEGIVLEEKTEEEPEDNKGQHQDW